jgi:hypothetical protein
MYVILRTKWEFCPEVYTDIQMVTRIKHAAFKILALLRYNAA